MASKIRNTLGDDNDAARQSNTKIGHGQGANLSQNGNHPVEIKHLDAIRIEIDDADDRSSIGDLSVPGFSASTKSNGRTYSEFKEGSYIMPNDKIEQNRLDMQHHLWLMTLGDKLVLAPAKKNPQHVLDLGCGTGIWAIDFAIKYPSTFVVGSDLSPVPGDFIPSNCMFQVEDAEDEWTYSQRFDLIHGRLLISCFKDPRRVLERAFHHLAPGGYLEMQDGDFPMRTVDDSLKGTAFWEWNLCILNGAAKAGRPWTNVSKYKGWMEDIGFIDVNEKLLIWPVNTWPKDPHLKKLGLWFQHDLLEGLNSTRTVLTRGLGWSDEKVEDFLVDVRKDINNRDIHAYAVMHIVYGKKPEDQ